MRDTNIFKKQLLFSTVYKGYLQNTKIVQIVTKVKWQMNIVFGEIWMDYLFQICLKVQLMV